MIESNLRTLIRFQHPMSGRLARRLAASLALGTIGLAIAATSATAQSKYDAEIKIGNTMPYSGPASGYAVVGKSEAAYFKKINAEGGINGRRINFISYDDGAFPPRTVKQVRKLIEGDE